MLEMGFRYNNNKNKKCDIALEARESIMKN